MYIFGSQRVKRAMIGGRKIKFAGSSDQDYLRELLINLNIKTNNHN